MVPLSCLVIATVAELEDLPSLTVHQGKRSLREVFDRCCMTDDGALSVDCSPFIVLLLSSLASHVPHFGVDFDCVVAHRPNPSERRRQGRSSFARYIVKLH